MDSDRLIGIIALVVALVFVAKTGQAIVRGVRLYGNPRVLLDRHVRLHGGIRGARNRSGPVNLVWLVGELVVVVIAVGLVIAPRHNEMITVTGKYYEPAGYHTTATYGIETAHGTWFAPDGATYQMMEKGLTYRCRVTGLWHDRDLDSCRPAAS